ncbi:hypothetical protein A4X09_0g6172 [Tilletia walkeri]|uniref:GTP cyclohydrolase II n=1 Tax=Tilletia walkeri TaxID=117179 RepID=A0A8X7N5U6_9BASI|nr:hypothetical protein A4X09_0g6172 [Tilletia walkeri]
MEAHSHSHHHSHHNHHHHHPHPEPLRYTQPTQADEAFLDLITSSAFAPPSSIIRRPLTTLAALRRPPIDPIVLAATLSSGPHVTRHHFHHSFDGKQPDASHSQQMPASVRRAKIQQQRQKQQQQQQGESWTTSAGESTSSARASAAAAALSSDNQHTDDNNNDRPRYVSTQAPRSLRLAREHSQPGADIDSKAKTALPRQVTPPVPTTETNNSSSSMRRIPAPFPPPPLIVRCHARTRIPTPHGEVFTYIYKNNRDSKEHLALVVDPIQNDDVAVEYYRGKSSGGGGGRVRARKGEIRSTSLDELWGVGESDMERIVRGAYVGRLGGEYQIASAPPSSHPSHSDSDSDDDEEEEESDPPLVRIHSECYTGETIGSQRCDCGEQLDEAIRLIAAEDEIMNPPRHNHHHRRRTAAHRTIADEDSLAQSQAALGSSTPTILTHAPPSPSLPSGGGGGGGGGGAKPRRARGIVVYLRQEGRGIGLLDKLMAYNLQDMGHDTVSANILLGHSADARTYDVAAAILRDLGVVGGVRLLTNNPEKVEGMEREGVRVFERVPMVPRMWRTRREGGRRRRGGKKTSSSKKKKEGKREKERGTTMLSPVRKTVRAKSPLSSPGMTPSVSGGVSAGVGGAAPFRPSLLGVHSRILSQASGFGTESEDGDGDEGVEYEEEEREDEEGNLSQAEAAEMSLTRSTSSGASGRGRGVAGGGGGVNAAIRFHLSEDPDPAVSQRASSSSPSPSPSSASASDSEEDDEDSDDSYDAHVLRRSGATMIGADVTRSRELERYLRTKVERMGHMLDLPSQGKGEGSAEKGK